MKDGWFHFIHGGLRVEINDRLCIDIGWVQYRFPKRKSWRVVKKWRKNRNNFRLEERHRAIQVGDVLYVSSLGYEALKKSPWNASNAMRPKTALNKVVSYPGA